MELGALDYLSKREGAPAIISEIRGFRPPAGTSLAESDEVDFLCQLASLSQSLTDMLQITDSTAGHPETSQQALRSARRIALDISKLTTEERTVGR